MWTRGAAKPAQYTVHMGLQSLHDHEVAQYNVHMGLQSLGLRRSGTLVKGGGLIMAWEGRGPCLPEDSLSHEDCCIRVCSAAVSGLLPAHWVSQSGFRTLSRPLQLSILFCVDLTLRLKAHDWQSNNNQEQQWVLCSCSSSQCLSFVEKAPEKTKHKALRVAECACHIAGVGDASHEGRARLRAAWIDSGSANLDSHALGLLCVY